MLQDKTQWLTNIQKIKTYQRVKNSLFNFNQKIIIFKSLFNIL